MDVEFPAECDDEYWAHPDPEQAFKQPADKPSVLAFFNCCLKLKQIHAFALRTLVCARPLYFDGGSLADFVVFRSTQRRSREYAKATLDQNGNSRLFQRWTQP